VKVDVEDRNGKRRRRRRRAEVKEGKMEVEEFEAKGMRKIVIGKINFFSSSFIFLLL
jgi:hypothetical protein